MRFWDSSALVPLCLAEPRSARVRAIYREDPEMVVWWGSPVECASAFARLRREGLLDVEGEDSARSILAKLRDGWHEVQPARGLRERAIRLLRLHPLKGADSLQLAAGVEWAGTPRAASFVTFDDRLRESARLEGFSVT